MTQDARIHTLSEEKPVKAVLKLGVPLTMGMMIMVAYNLTDTFFIGLLHDDYQFAAVNLAYPLMMITTALSNMVGTGASSLMARSMGAGDTDKANRTLTCGYVMTVVLGVVIAFLGLIFLGPLVRLLGAKSHTFTPTCQYAGVILAGTVFTMGNYTFGQLLRAEGSVKESVGVMLAGTLVNLVLDPVFIFVLHMNVMGAAVATIIGNAVAALLAVSFYVRKKTILSLRKDAIIPQAAIVKEIFFVGIPATLETLMTSCAYVLLNNLAVSYGELYVAAMGVSQKIMTVGNYVYQGFAAGTQPLMGYNYGAGRYSRMLACLKANIMVTCLIELVIVVIYGFGAEALVSVFISTPEVIAIGAQVLRANMLVLPFVGSISSSRSAFQAMGRPFDALGITILRQIVMYMPFLLIFNHFFGFNGLIHAQPVSDAIMCIVAVTHLVRVLRSLERTHAYEQ